MAKVRLFANLREIAGTSHLDLASDTVGEAIETLNDKFGHDFRSVVDRSRVWVNGEEAGPDRALGEHDELVILPPVSGGSQPATLAAGDLAVFLPLGVALAAVLANTQGQPIWAAVLVAITAVWAVDINSAFAARGRAFAPLAVVTAVVTSTLAAHILGPTGYGLAMALAVAMVLGWAVAFPAYRRVDVFAPTLLVALIGALAAASAILTRSAFTPDPEAIDVLLAATIAGVLLGALAARVPSLPFLDRFTTTALGSVLGAVGAAVLWDLDVVGYLLIGVGIAVALVAGHGLSSMLRTGRVLLANPPPGFLTALDGIALAAALYFPMIRLVL